MEKIINISSVLAFLFSQAGCIGRNEQEQEKTVSFPYATQEIKEELAEQLLGVKAIPSDYFETLGNGYTELIRQIQLQGVTVLGEKEEQRIFWFYLTRLRFYTLYYTQHTNENVGIFSLVRLHALEEMSTKFTEEQPQKAQEMLASVIAYEETYPYNLPKALDQTRTEIRNLTREQAAKVFKVSLDKLNTMSDEEFAGRLQKEADGIKDITPRFEQVRAEMLQLYKNELAQMKSGLTKEEYSIKIKVEEGLGEQELERAAMEENAKQVKFLLDLGVKVDSKDVGGYPLFFQVAMRGNKEIIKLFLDAGADVHAITDEEGRTVLDLDLPKEIKTFLLRGGIETGKDIPLSTNSHEQIKAVPPVQANAAIDTKDQAGRTPLLIAVQRGDVEKVKELIAQGANVNATDMLDNSILMVAVISNQVDMAKLLIDAGADVNFKNAFGKSVLKKAEQKGFTEIAELLKAAGAKE